MRAERAGEDCRPRSACPPARSPRDRGCGSGRLRPIEMRAPRAEPMRNCRPMLRHWPCSCVLPGRSVVIKWLVGPSQQICRHRSPGALPGQDDLVGGALCAVRPGAELLSRPLRTGRWIRKSCRRRGAIKIHAYCPHLTAWGPVAVLTRETPAAPATSVTRTPGRGSGAVRAAPGAPWARSAGLMGETTTRVDAAGRSTDHARRAR